MVSQPDYNDVFTITCSVLFSSTPPGMPASPEATVRPPEAYCGCAQTISARLTEYSVAAKSYSITEGPIQLVPDSSNTVIEGEILVFITCNYALGLHPVTGIPPVLSSTRYNNTHDVKMTQRQGHNNTSSFLFILFDILNAYNLELGLGAGGLLSGFGGQTLSGKVCLVGLFVGVLPGLASL
ncbi:hypothetical protein AG1IA_08225 [Rhizoctonia solani AG-1 IA]|uniref:Uncharacterized protein n=1 Tax=Thanatephorus cucumeris (strain AG1-IA) TaxID=983506 RepID=L8WIK7_THACA|nr:hypothetical protein AG1IA_08225 [Rhizoctonia solani AG-1 IA]